MDLNFMIKSIMVENPKKETMILELSNPEAAGIYVKSIEGLGPGKATINVNSIATSDGGVFASSRVDARNIILTLGMMFSPLIEDSRHKIYRYFPIKKPIRLTVETDRRVSYIDGYVEANEPDIFSQEETAQISVICPNPWFYDLGSSVSTFSGVENLFEFPFSNESLESNLIIFGDIRQGLILKLDYKGDIDTGILMKIRFLDNIEELTIFNLDTNESMTLHLDRTKDITGSNFDKNDEIEISTFTGNKYIYLIRNGEYYNFFPALDKMTSWFKITNGINQFAFTANGHEESVIIEISYKNMYGGI